MRDPYQVLGLAPGATKEEVEAAYRAAAKAAHPDQGGTDEAMAEVNAARDRIKAFLAGDAVYDPNDFDEPDPGAQQQPPPSGGGGQSHGYNPFGGGYGEAMTGEDAGEFIMGPNPALGFEPFGLHFRPEPAAPWHRLSHIPFDVSAYIEDPTGEGASFEIAFPQGGRAARATVPCELLLNSKKLATRLERLGLQLSSNKVVYAFAKPVLHPEGKARTRLYDVRAYELLARWFREQRPECTKRMVDRSGWHETPDGWAFAFPDGAVYGAQSIVLRNPKGDPDRDAKWAPQGTSDDWRREVAARVLGNPWHMACVCLSFSGPLLAHLRNPPRGGLNGFGDTSIGKTIGTACGASVYGLGANGGLVSGWNGTPSSMEEMAAEHCDLALFLDDMGQAPEKSDVALIVYALANHAARGRKGQRRLFWQTLMISTAEVSLARFLGRHMTGGLETRLPSFNVELPGKTSFTDIHGATSHKTFANALEAACRTTYGAVGREWITFLASHYLNTGRRGELTELLEDRMADFIARHAPEDPLGQVHQVARSLGLCAAVGELAAEHGFVGWPEGAATAAMAGLLQAWFDQRGTGSSKDRQTLEAIGRYIVLNPNRFPPLGVKEGHEILGWRETVPDGEQILMLDVQWKELCRRCDVLDPAQAATLFADLGYMPRKGSNIGVQRTLRGYARQWLKLLLPQFIARGGTLDPDAEHEGDDNQRRQEGMGRLIKLDTRRR